MRLQHSAILRTKRRVKVDSPAKPSRKSLHAKFTKRAKPGVINEVPVSGDVLFRTAAQELSVLLGFQKRK